MSKLTGFLAMRSLQTRITAGMLILVLLVLWTAVFLLGRTLRQDMEKTISAQQFSTVALLAIEIDRSIRERQDMVQRIAEGYRPALLRNSNAAQANLERYPVPDSLFNWGIMIVDQRGMAVASVPPNLQRTGVNFHDYPGVREVLSGSGHLITDPLFSEHSQRPVFAILSPILDEQQQVIGVAIGVTNLHQANFLDQIGSLRYGTTGDFMITAPATRSYVTTSDKKRLLKSGPPPGVNPIYDRYINGYEGSGIARSSRGIVELTSSKRIPATGWLMQSVLPTSEAFAPIDTMEEQLYLASAGLTVLLGLLCAWWLGRQFRPLAETSQLLQRMHRGEVPRQALPVHKNDEIGQLTAAFNRLQEVIISDEAKAAERHANARLRQIVADVPGVVFEYCLHADGRGSFPFASDALQAIFGCPPAAVADDVSYLRTLTHPDDLAEFISSQQAAAQNLTPWRHAYRIVLPDGTLKWLLVRAIPEAGNDGSVIFRGFVADITEMKQLETELREALAEHQRKDAEIEHYRDHLEQLVEERTADLERARAEAERLAATKSEFLAKMSHEIRTPLHGVLGVAHIGLRHAPPDSKTHDAFIKIQQSGKLLLGIINDILDFSKMEAGMFRVEHIPVALPALLAESIDLVHERAISKHLQLSLNLDASLPANCLSDPLRVQQILLNLLANAIKFTSAGSVTLSADLDQGQLRFAVRDTGIGIAPENIAKICKPFEQADNSMTRRYGGSGLGLAITEHLIRLLGGSLSIESTVGSGSCFTVHLPYLPISQTESPAP